MFRNKNKDKKKTNIYDDFTLEKIVNLIRGDKND